jgi:hypothetical protein
MERYQEYEVFLYRAGMKALHRYFLCVNSVTAFIHPSRERYANMIWHTIGGCGRKWFTE